MTLRVLVVDDQPLARAGAAMLLDAEPDLTVVGQAADGESAIRLAAELAPDVVLMDLRMPGMGGVAATRALADAGDGTTRVLVMTTFDDEELVDDALRAGASGYLLKHASPSEMADAVRRVAAGDLWLDPGVTARLLGRLRPAAAETVDLTALLTPREQEVLRYVAAGLSNLDIRRLLVLSEATVKTHVARILLKTGARDRAAVVALAYRCGFVSPDDPVPGGRISPTR